MSTFRITEQTSRGCIAAAGTEDTANFPSAYIGTGCFSFYFWLIFYVHYDERQKQ